jgi:hypothetical protein
VGTTHHIHMHSPKDLQGPNQPQTATAILMWIQNLDSDTSFEDERENQRGLIADQRADEKSGSY